MLVPLGTLVSATVLLVFIARKVAAGETKLVDERVHAFLQARRTRALDIVTKPITTTEHPAPHRCCDSGDRLVASSHRSQQRSSRHRRHADHGRRTRPGVHELLSPAEAPEAVVEESGKSPATFPSGHTTGVTAEALAIAYVLFSERLASPAAIAGLLAWPLLSASSRLYRDRHWLSDTVAGWVAGIGVASISILLYDAHFL